MRLTTMTQVTVDGVMQGNGGSSAEDRASGLQRGGWARGRGDEQTQSFIRDLYGRADAFLFGRRTYEVFAGSWGSLSERDVPGWEPVLRALNAKPKYVVSTTLTHASWSGTSVLSGDVLADVRELKAMAGGEVQVHGSGVLVRSLLAHGLVDELTLITIPVILGQGARLFPQSGPDIALDLLESHVDTKGVTTQVFRPAGRPVYPTTDEQGRVQQTGDAQVADS
ncbi:dihydrofolate reductase [Planctomonas sp. JC2975]|uniref:dihydrofolate reductase family protein n=1 Tax=Planctomonas sp. JC2975 TaxID=2729626 RepID=UPI0014759DBA|nr:dihydrofolate reductase family protein [Planctomonas sp. JC2975]NNC13524.1 dihydrofolate reductase [Planctomonas sp. JC2975]